MISFFYENYPRDVAERRDFLRPRQNASDAAKMRRDDLVMRRSRRFSRATCHLSAMDSTLQSLPGSTPRGWCLAWAVRCLGVNGDSAELLVVTHRPAGALPHHHRLVVGPWHCAPFPCTWWPALLLV